MERKHAPSDSESDAAEAMAHMQDASVLLDVAQSRDDGGAAAAGGDQVHDNVHTGRAVQRWNRLAQHGLLKPGVGVVCCQRGRIGMVRRHVGDLLVDAASGEMLLAFQMAYGERRTFRTPASAASALLNNMDGWNVFHYDARGFAPQFDPLLDAPTFKMLETQLPRQRDDADLDVNPRPTKRQQHTERNAMAAQRVKSAAQARWHALAHGGLVKPGVGVICWQRMTRSGLRVNGIDSVRRERFVGDLVADPSTGHLLLSVVVHGQRRDFSTPSEATWATMSYGDGWAMMHYDARGFDAAYAVLTAPSLLVVEQGLPNAAPLRAGFIGRGGANGRAQQAAMRWHRLVEHGIVKPGIGVICRAGGIYGPRVIGDLVPDPNVSGHVLLAFRIRDRMQFFVNPTAAAAELGGGRGANGWVQLYYNAQGFQPDARLELQNQLLHLEQRIPKAAVVAVAAEEPRREIVAQHRGGAWRDVIPGPNVPAVAVPAAAAAVAAAVAPAAASTQRDEPMAPAAASAEHNADEADDGGEYAPESDTESDEEADTLQRAAAARRRYKHAAQARRRAAAAVAAAMAPLPVASSPPADVVPAAAAAQAPVAPAAAVAAAPPRPAVVLGDSAPVVVSAESAPSAPLAPSVADAAPAVSAAAAAVAAALAEPAPAEAQIPVDAFAQHRIRLHVAACRQWMHVRNFLVTLRGVAGTTPMAQTMRPQGLVMIEMAIPSLSEYIKTLLQHQVASPSELSMLWRLLTSTVQMCREAGQLSDAHWFGLISVFDRVMHWLMTAA